MAIYRLKPKQRHNIRVGRTIRELKPGDEIELTPTQARALADKFEFVSDKPKAVAGVEVKTTEAPRLRKEEHPFLDGKFNVVHPETNQPVNDDPLTEAEANELVAGK